jgi:glycosyltransferase involved in cell wall biosynthesis
MTTQQEKLPISVFIVAQDEEQNIARLLKSCGRMNEIIMVDSGSRDKTIEIAENLGAKVSHHPWHGYAAQKAYAMSLCSHEWVLNLDADEELTEQLVDALAQKIADDDCAAVRCQRNDVFIARDMNRWLKKPNNCRFYKQSLASFDVTKQVHESADIDGREISIPQYFNHYGYSTVELVTNKTNLYSSLRADEKHARKKRSSGLKLALIFPLVFIKTWLIQRHILFGWRGFILSITTSYYAFMKEAKLYEREHSE